MKPHSRRLLCFTAALLAVSLLTSCSLIPQPNYDPVITLAPDDTFDPGEVHVSKTSGTAATKTGTTLNMLVNWEREYGYGEDTLRLTVYLLADTLVLPSDKDKDNGTITVGEDVYRFPPQYDLVDIDDPVLVRMILCTMTTPIPRGEPVDVTVTWPLAIDYYGKEFTELHVAFTIE